MRLELLILAIAPVITIVLWIYLKDKYETLRIPNISSVEFGKVNK